MSGEELRALAEAATPGPWGWGGAGVGTDYWDGREELPIARTDWTNERGLTREWMDRNRDNGRFIAAANPTAVLALLDERDALRAQVAYHDDWRYCPRCGRSRDWTGELSPGAPCMVCGRYPASRAALDPQ